MYARGFNRRDGVILHIFILIEPTQHDADVFIEKNETKYKRFLAAKVNK